MGAHAGAIFMIAALPLSLFGGSLALLSLFLACATINKKKYKKRIKQIVHGMQFFNWDKSQTSDGRTSIEKTNNEQQQLSTVFLLCYFFFNPAQHLVVRCV